MEFIIYTKIKEMNDNQSLIGMSTEEVIEVLEKPKAEYSIKERKYRVIFLFML